MIQNQSSEFIFYILCGIFISIIFDLFRSLRLSIKTSDYTVNTEDAIFIIIVGFILINAIYKYNYGIVRLYIPVGIILGCIIYYYFISKTVMQINTYIIKSLSKKFKLFFEITIKKIGINFCSLMTNIKKIANKVKKH